MPYGSTVDDLVSNYAPLPNIVINILVVYLSFKYINSSILRTFALNLSVPALAYSTYMSVITFIRFPMSETDKDGSFMEYSTDFVLNLCAYEYRLLSILLVTVTCINMSWPMFANRNFHKRNIVAFFALCHVLALSISIVSTISNIQSEQLVLHRTRDVSPIDWTDVIETIVEMGSFVLMLGLYVVCMKSVISYTRLSSSGPSAKRKQQRNDLIAILIYITMPNILLTPNSLCTDIMAVVFYRRIIVMKYLCEWKILFHDSLLALRLFIASFSLLFAFPYYRRSIVQLLRCTKPSVVQTSTVKVQPTPS
ncbi:hypothetical protein QR680_006084 [Steinernema hermaphroditum]|uniref:Uncharacterized protein n=1 Tax=Steinernema hermaphroditum TaxID=289476 RepID=A0AA39HWK4_9BILA|nr:hypothetical protein QR680_006084 [Steinernema hermaphroditum]